jgi:uncharacterized membrane protein
MEELLGQFAAHVALVLEAISVLLVAIGAAEATVRTLWPALTGRATQASRREAWLGLARWLLMALEFMLAADIVRSIVAPGWNEIGQLAAIAAIRTFLSFFLERDLEAAAHLPVEP